MDNDTSTLIPQVGDEPATEVRSQVHALGETPECPAGLVRIDSGADTNHDGVLDVSEVHDTRTFCLTEVAPGTAAGAALVMVLPEAAGEHCSNGGQKLVSGRDNGAGGVAAGDGQLEGDEILRTEYVCSGAVGFASLTKITAEPQGPVCPAGGQKIEMGADNGDGGGLARDNKLTSGEVDSRAYVCNGQRGAAGAAGANGLTPLFRIGAVASSEQCPDGGQQIDMGFDNGDGGGVALDGILATGEVNSSVVLCHGADGQHGSDGADLTVQSIVEEAGAHCSNGGYRLLFGYDDGRSGTAGDQVLDGDEIHSSQYLCNGVDGSDGYAALTAVSALELTDDRCATGGQLVKVGLDSGGDHSVARDGVLATEEVDYDFVLCNGPAGADGFGSLVDTSAADLADCPAGGLHLRLGTDNGADGGTARDGVMQSGEVRYEYDVCDGENGEDGAQGSPGFNALVTRAAIGTGEQGCSAGGTLVSWGLDDGLPTGTPRDGVLQAGEVDDDAVVCNGVQGVQGQQGSQGSEGAAGEDGLSTLVTTFELQPDADCPAGGVRLDFGGDDGNPGGTASNGLLEPEEIDVTYLVCHGVDGEAGAAGSAGSPGSAGTDGFTTLAGTSSNVGSNCENGGTRLDLGLDDGHGAGTARDGILHGDEIDSTQYLCNGEDGEDGADGLGSGIGMGTIRDANGVLLGTVIALDSWSGINVYTSQGYYYWIGWDGSFGDSQMFNKGTCASPGAYYLNCGSSGCPLYARMLSYLDERDTFFAPIASSLDDVIYSSSTTYTSAYNGSPCAAQAGTLGMWPMEPISRAAAGIPEGTVALPLLIE